MTNKLWQSVLLIVLTMLVSAPSFAAASKDDPARVATREKMRRLLAQEGPKINVTFQQSEKAPFNFIGIMKTGLTNADQFKIVISVTASSTIGFRIYPHYKDAYINVDKATDPKGLMKTLLQLSNTNFLFWGADETSDVFFGYTVTLESGFPTAALDVVIRSIPNQDKFVGLLAPFINDKPAG